MLHFKKITGGLMLLLLLTAGCSEENLLTGPVTEDGVTTSESDSDANISNSGDDSGDDQEATVYEFLLGDLPYNCGWDNDNFPNPYENIHFEETPRWSVCWKGGISGMTEQVINPMDTRYYGSRDVRHTTIAHLPEPVDVVSISTANHRAQRGSGEYYSSLTAYDEEGNEIDVAENALYYRSSSTNRLQATVLTVAGDARSRIHSVGITTYQNATYLANLKVVINHAQQQTVDQTPPEIFFTVERNNLWPSNHKMVLAMSNIHAVDETSDSVNLEVTVESNESINGKGDGNHSPDWDLVENTDGSFDLYLRAERNGPGSDRIYTIQIRAEDASNNTAEETYDIIVPHQN